MRLRDMLFIMGCIRDSEALRRLMYLACYLRDSQLVYHLLFPCPQAQFDPAVRERLTGGTCNRSSRRCIGFLHS